jgi:NADH-quinone oxidoreductase subunit J
LKLAGALSGGILLLVLVAALRDSELKSRALDGADGNIGLIGELGKVLFTDYLIPFEISSVLFLSAMVGAVLLGRKE